MIKKFEQYVTTTWNLNPEYDYDTEKDYPVRKEKPDDNIGRYIINALEKYGVDENKRSTSIANDAVEYKLHIVNSQILELDPYGEENWDSEPRIINFKIEKNKQESYSFYIKIKLPPRPGYTYGSEEYEKLDVSNEIIEKIIFLLKSPERNKKLRKSEEEEKEKQEKKDLIRKNVFGN